MLIKAKEVSKLTSTPLSRVYEMGRSPERFGLPPGIVFRFGQSVRFNEENLKRFLSGQTVTPPENGDNCESSNGSLGR